MKKNKDILKWVLLVSLALIWGSSFILMHKGMETSDGQSIFDSNQVASIRMSIAGLVLLPFALRSLKKITRKTIVPFLISGFFGNFFPAFLFTFSEVGLDSSFVGMLNSSVPILTIIIGFIVFKTKVSNRQIVGLLIGIGGILGLVLSNSNGIEFGGGIIYILAVLGATTCYAISINTIKNKMQDLKAMEITSLSFFLTLIPSLIITIFISQDINWNQDYTIGLGYISILAIVGTAFAVLIYSKLIQISSALFASSVTYLIPIVATFWGLINKEKITWIQVLFMSVLLVGVLIINTKGKRRVGIK